MKQAEYRKERISFTDQGKGRVIVLVHGFLGSAAIWSDLAAQLSKSYRVIAIDLPGHGATPCIGYVHSMELMAGCIKSVLDSLRLRRYVMVGHSMGGYAALAFAEFFPDRLRGLCLMHSSALADTPQKKTDRNRAIRLVQSNKNLYTNNTIKELFAEHNLKYLKKEISFASSIARKASRRGIVACLIGMRDRPARDTVLAMVPYPVLMVIGKHDKLLPYEMLLEQAGSSAKIETLLLEHDGHFGFLESPREVMRRLRKFVRGIK